MWRDIYTLSLNPELFVESSNLRDLIDRTGLGNFETGPTRASHDVDALCDVLTGRARDSEVLLRATVESMCDDDRTKRAIHCTIAHSAPLASVLGRWLQGLSRPGNFEDDVQLKSLALLADDVGVGLAEMSRTDGFRHLARKAGLVTAAGRPHDIAADRELSDGVFRFPAIMLALSRCSEAFEPEIAGVDYALRTIGLLPVWRVLAHHLPGPHWRRLNLSASQTDALPSGHTPLSLSRHILDYHASRRERRARVMEGILWVINAVTADTDDFVAALKHVDDPTLAMERLIQGRAREAAIYHQGFDLEGKPLSQWFTEAIEDPRPLIDAIARSRLIRRGDPERSPLLGSLLSSQGRMFRIFEPDDIAVIRRWILSLVPAPSSIKPASPLAITPVHQQSIKCGDLMLGAVPSNIREAYHLLQGRALPPRTRRFALEYAQFWLGAARRSIGLSKRSLPETWQHGLLRAWLLDTHASHDEAFQRTKTQSMPSREQLVEETVQLAPLTLIDGAWLQGFSEVDYASDRVGSPLFRIFWDELGNGNLSINHPRIYRALLLSMDIDLPPTGSPQFPYDPRLRSESLRLPVFWLCLGKLPVTLRPEILGLNLAMELSGVGGSYRSARQILKHYGFSTQFVDMHNTIDNVSTGHSAWAADAIDAHMALASQFVDPDEEWERIRAGFEALSPVTGRSSELDFFKQQKRPWRAMVAREPSYV
ncbi:MULTISPECIES: iron-containing redox enzyme family protein [unclassified Thiobacillus]|uniref:Iron-containing redox enzyme family protein n=1 Tax=Thiobacillus sedimenti TaxID=3110231 RepID=A0ABZ1CG93_9PROT|nr:MULTISPECIES: iron-containing redox enzyme family protein [unclassified Thiobacillus]OJY54847.1 MAG: hypothetical protein BGP19_08505 [Thiobacillus sp. 0-1251]TXH74742.1 MAG: iron-containing redox enzyme family protein [Thiobacillus sp.]WRS38226.1 iron-containing redox enzyme family protein [Thiobacillus sp. SCUT-2]